MGQIKYILTIAAAVALSIMVGFLIATSDSYTVIILLVVMGLIHLLHLHRYTVELGIFFVCLGFTFAPAGFKISALEIGCALGVALALIYMWQKQKISTSPALEQPSFRVFQLLLLAWIVYLVGHLLYTKENPFHPQDFSLNNALKTYMGSGGPLLMLWYFSRNPAGIRYRGEPFDRIAGIALGTLVLNVVIRLYHIATGTDVSSDMTDSVVGAITIPGIEASEGAYTLRTLGPFACMIGAVALSSARARGFGFGARVVYWLLVILGVIGGLLSGGRASFVCALGAIFLILLLRKQTRLVVLSMVAGLVLVIGLNIMSGWINESASPLIQRSVSWVLINGNQEARDSLTSSTNWRRELFSRAVDEWLSDPRIYWFGRSTYSFGSADLVAIEVVGGYQAVMDSTLRRGATHNAVTDLLICYGLVGCVLNYAMFFSMLYFLWRLYRNQKLSSKASDLTLLCLVLAIFLIVLGFFGVGSNYMELMWCLVLLVALLRDPAEAHAAEEAPPILIHSRERRRALAGAFRV